jgi:hypothetical protein
LKVYERCGLSNLRADAPLPAYVRRKNDGRFFYADERRAEMLATALDPAR